jgi:hypothetical protein
MRLGVLTKAVLAQSGAMALAAVTATFFDSHAMPVPLLAALQALLAVLLAWCLRSDPWWLLIHAVFVPAAAAVHALGISPGWYLLGFLLLLLLFGPAVRSRVPLYLSSEPAVALMSSIIERYVRHPHSGGAPRILDFGSGTGSMVRGLAQRCTNCRVDGIEAAWLPHLIASVRLAGIPNARLTRGDFWSVDLAEYDLVYAFLSTEPMPRLWEKVCAEMREGSVLVSNSFPVPSIVPSEVLEADDARRSQLYIYRLASPRSAHPEREGNDSEDRGA